MTVIFASIALLAIIAESVFPAPVPLKFAKCFSVVTLYAVKSWLSQGVIGFPVGVFAFIGGIGRFVAPSYSSKKVLDMFLLTSFLWSSSFLAI